jgi:hypothetical protein
MTLISWILFLHAFGMFLTLSDGNAGLLMPSFARK